MPLLGSARSLRPSASSRGSAAWAAGQGRGERLQRQDPAQQTGTRPEEEVRPEVQLGRAGPRQDQRGLELTKGTRSDC